MIEVVRVVIRRILFGGYARLALPMPHAEDFVGLSVLTAAFFLVSHKVLLRIPSHNGNAADTASLIWTNFVKTAVFISVSFCFLAVHFTVYFVVAWLH